jgi:succinate dehydrogenase / fumarate reductase cytochrome b subunit
MNATATNFPIVSRVWKSSIGRKYVVAITGLILVGFIAGHLAGNLLVFKGREAFNDYAEFLHSVGHGMLIWGARAVLLVAVLLHIFATISLTRENKAARIPYAYQATIQAPKSSLIMIWTGLTLLAFIILHLMQFTFKAGSDYSTYLEYPKAAASGFTEPLSRPDAWKMVIVGFSSWPVVIFYIIAMSLLCSHVSHGVGAMFQTLGLRSKKAAPIVSFISRSFATVVLIGFISIPIGIKLFGFGAGQ